MSVNVSMLEGYVGYDAKDFTSPGGTRIVSFSICNTEKGKEGKPDTQTWADCKIFGYKCDSAIKFKKGDHVIVTGKLKTPTYKDKNGIEKRGTEIVGFDAYRIEKQQGKPAIEKADPIQNSNAMFDEFQVPF